MSIEFNAGVLSVVNFPQELPAQATRALNLCLTLRKWMIGYYIDAFELRGFDRAEYGDQLFAKLSSELTTAYLSNGNKRQPFRYLQLFRNFPQIVGTLSPQLQRFLLADRVAYE